MTVQFIQRRYVNLPLELSNSINGIVNVIDIAYSETTEDTVRNELKKLENISMNKLITAEEYLKTLVDIPGDVLVVIGAASMFYGLKIIKALNNSKIEYTSLSGYHADFAKFLHTSFAINLNKMHIGDLTVVFEDEDELQEAKDVFNILDNPDLTVHELEDMVVTYYSGKLHDGLIAMEAAYNVK